jgi:hypothetical protein
MLIPFMSTAALASPVAKQSACFVEQIADRNFVESALNRDDVKALRGFLLGMGYQSADGLSIVSSVRCEGNKQQATVTIIPLTKDGITLSAHITFWQGNWNSKDLEGSIAVVETSQDVVYSYDAKKDVISESKENWGKQAKIPFDGIQGFQLPMTTDLEVTETTDAPSQLLQENSSIQPLATTYCKTVQAARVGYTLLGFVAYKFWERVYFCYNGVSAVSNVNVSAYVSNMDSQHYYRGVVNQWGYYVGTSYDSMRQGQIDNCVLKYGCIGSYYPAVQIIAYKDGSWYYGTWQ